MGVPYHNRGYKIAWKPYVKRVQGERKIEKKKTCCPYTPRKIPVKSRSKNHVGIIMDMDSWRFFEYK